MLDYANQYSGARFWNLLALYIYTYQNLISGGDSPYGEDNDRVAEPGAHFFMGDHLKHTYTPFLPGGSWVGGCANGLCKTDAHSS